MNWDWMNTFWILTAGLFLATLTEIGKQLRIIAKILSEKAE